MHKYKFSKTRCKTCIYRGGNQSTTGKGSIYCNYAGITNHTCLYREGKEVVDRRGNDYYDCQLYEAGDSHSGKNRPV